MLGVLIVALMSAGSVSMATVPQACLVYVGLLTAGGVAMTMQFERPVHTALMLIFALAVAGSAISSARRFVGHVRTQIDLQEQSALIALLREFEASGSDWLWQLDQDLKLTYMSRAMAEAIGKPLSKLMGSHARRILDPDGNAVQLSAGMRRLMLHAAERTAFRDVAIPIDHGRRWWSISAKPLVDAEGEFQGWRGVGSDITDIRLSGSDAVRAARLDPLTGVANRLLLREQLEEALLRQVGGDLRLRASAGRPRPLQAGQRYARPFGRRPIAVRSRAAARTLASAPTASSAASAATNSRSSGAVPGTRSRWMPRPARSSPS